MSELIRCKNLGKSYGKKKVFEHLDFSVREGSILGLLGRNGTGKTTVINILNGFLAPTEGECLIYGENSGKVSPEIKARIGYLMEGHIQYPFMNIVQLERFYSGCYVQWKREPYWELMKKMHADPRQKLSDMSCGQRSQVALGLILAQDPDLLILDDFSMGLDPGYRRLFVDYLREYAKAERKTIFTTSHIIQDLERLIDDVLILGNHSMQTQRSLSLFMKAFHLYTFTLDNPDTVLPMEPILVNLWNSRNHVEIYTWENLQTIREYLQRHGLSATDLREVPMTLEDAFIGLTGKY